jgi:hypothetical protein
MLIFVLNFEPERPKDLRINSPQGSIETARMSWREQRTNTWLERYIHTTTTTMELLAVGVEIRIGLTIQSYLSDGLKARTSDYQPMVGSPPFPVDQSSWSSSSELSGSNPPCHDRWPLLIPILASFFHKRPPSGVVRITGYVPVEVHRKLPKLIEKHDPSPSFCWEPDTSVSLSDRSRWAYCDENPSVLHGREHEDLEPSLHAHVVHQLGDAVTHCFVTAGTHVEHS